MAFAQPRGVESRLEGGHLGEGTLSYFVGSLKLKSLKISEFVS